MIGEVSEDSVASFQSMDEVLAHRKKVMGDDLVEPHLLLWKELSALYVIL